MIITIGKVNAVVIPSIIYAALFKKPTNQYIYDMFDVDYSCLLKRVIKIAREVQ